MEELVGLAWMIGGNPIPIKNYSAVDNAGILGSVTWKPLPVNIILELPRKK